jgi:hypothetical protein
METLHFYKSNVSYTIAVRLFIGDPKGKVLTQSNPYIVIKDDDLRDFKRANKKSIQDGLIVETKEPDWEEDTPNSIDDAKAGEIVKNVFALKKALASFTSEIPIRKLLDAAEEQKRPKKTIDLIKSRLIEIAGDDEDILTPDEMRGELNG